MATDKNARCLYCCVGFSIMCSIIAIIISILHVEPFVVTETTYIGFIVSLMAIIFALLVGYQIFNVIDTRKELKKIEKQKKEIEKTVKELSRYQKIPEAYSLSNKGLFAISLERYDDAISLFLKSMKLFFLSDIESLVGNIEHCLFQIKKSDSTIKEEVVGVFAEIKTTVNYSYLNKSFKERLLEIEKKQLFFFIH